MKPQRVVSLLGASTETIYRLGLGHVLVGRSHECDYPTACLSLPCVSRPRLDVQASSQTIDEEVRNHSANGQAIYQLDNEVIAQLQPDLIIAQDHCRVCAITPDDMKSSEACLNIPQVIVKPSNLQDCLDDVEIVATGLGYPERGILLKQTLQKRLDLVKDVVASSSCSSCLESRPRVALLEWCDPLMGCGYWLPELVQVAGGHPMHCPPPGGATPNISLLALLESKPDVVIFALCGFGLTRSAQELVQSWGPIKLQQLQQAVPRIRVVDGNYLVNRSGPRVVESAEVLAEAIHPSLEGHFGHYGTDFLCSLDDALAMQKVGVETGSAKVRPTPFPQGVSTKKEEAATNLPAELMPKEDAKTVVLQQLKFLLQQDFLAAFALNSTTNQARWCSHDRFASVLQSHADFCRLLKEEANVIGGPQVQGQIATVPVTLTKKQDEGQTSLPEVRLLWTMVLESSLPNRKTCWRTEKVGLAH